MNAIQYLLQSGDLDLTWRDKNGETVLEVVIKYCHNSHDIIPLLISHGHPLVGVYDTAASVGHVYACVLIRTAEHCQNLQLTHVVDLEVLFENQRLSGSQFVDTGETDEDLMSTWCRPFGAVCSREDVSISTGWAFDGDWQIDLRWPRVDTNGWQYSTSFFEPENKWSNDCSLSVRRRRWFRVRKLISISDQPTTTVSSPVDSVDYHQRSIEYARLASLESTVEKEKRLLQFACKTALGGLKDESEESRTAQLTPMLTAWITRLETLQTPQPTQQTIQHVQFTSPTSPVTTSPSPEPPASAYWQPDEDATHCSNSICKREFGLWVRRHHCRWCGLIFCDRCTLNRVTRCPGMVLSPDDSAVSFSDMMAGDKVRVCDMCFIQLSNSTSSFRQRSPTSPPNLRRPERRRRFLSHHVNPSSISDLTDDMDGGMQNDGDGDVTCCPVCGLRLDPSMSQADVEEHLNDCLTGSGKLSGAYYLPSILTEGMEGECMICFETYEVGQEIARLNCLCVFHRPCIDDWFSRGHKCPVHYL